VGGQGTRWELKRTMLQTMASSGIASKCSPRIMSRQPVVVTKTRPSDAASSMVVTSKPAMAAWRALIGSISVTMTRAPYERSDSAQPLPTSPKPATTATLPASMTSVARLIPSTSDSRQPYKLSNLDLVTALRVSSVSSRNPRY
jgi:hypothetical protein